ncbi:MAG: efflux RND transporter permease subunit [Gammaproteobacteria bacterium]|nr:efflux RND transporter permease subunit [Gammaproteobacteria bacterium]
MISWFARNSIAANLLMLAIVLWGIASLGNIIVEAHPSSELDIVTVNVSYRGATPAEVEESLVIRIEEITQDLEGIKTIRSEATEGLATVNIEVSDGYDPRELAEDIKSRVDTIDTFPDDSDRPIVTVAQRRWEVISVIVAADIPEAELRHIGEWVRDDLASLPGVSLVQLTAVRPYEVAVEVSEKNLRRYGLTLDDVAQTINRSSLNLPAGVVKTSSGEILLRTKGQAYVKSDFERIILLPREDGSHVRLGDIATVVDGFEEEPLSAFYNNQRSIKLEVYRVGKQSVIEIARTVKDYIADVQLRMPPGVTISYWRDHAKSIKIRLATLMNSAVQSIILIFIVLSLFLRLSVALWVSVGIPVAIIGSFAILPWMGISINYTSVGAFIMVLGLVVDDAIVTGESIYARLRNKLDSDSVTAAIKGTQDVAVPVTFGMLTTVIAFYGLKINGGGPFSRIFNIVPVVVIAVLLFSFIESKFILPAHLRHLKTDNNDQHNLISRWQSRVAVSLENAIARIYTPLLAKTIEHRYFSLSLFIGIALIVISLIASGQMGFTFFPRTQSDTARATLTMPVGTPFDITENYIRQIDQAAQRLQSKYIDPATQESIITSIFSTVGSTGGSSNPQSHLGRVMFQIVPPEIRTLDISSQQLAREWRRMIGPIPGAEQLSFVGHIRHGGMPLDIELKSLNYEQLTELSTQIQSHLSGYPGVFDISDNHESGKEEIQLSIKPEAELLGITLNDLALQVQQAFLGREAQRIQRGRDDVRIIVRYPAEERHSLANLKQMYIRTPAGTEVPFTDVAQLTIERSPATIYRTDRFRTLNVTADINKKTVRMDVLKRDLKVWLNETLSEYNGVQYTLKGETQDQEESFASVVSGVLLAVVGIYAMLAIPFRSYSQPLIVMSAIPFGLLGAVLGHLMLGMNLTINSILGMVALIGIVVNDSLVLVDFINRRILAGVDIKTAVTQAGAARFRPILLTSLTTFAGLLPLMFEKNVQAQFLIPMAVSLGFGVIFATFITLLLIPVNYMILDDLSGLRQKPATGKPA